MPQIPQYQVQTDDISNGNTRNTGGQATPQEFNPLQGMGSVIKGIDDLHDYANVRAAKEDMTWAQSRYAASQVQWIENAKGYTDPDKFTTDFQNYANDIAKNAPTGRAGDFFIQHMNTFVPRMVRKVLMNQAKAETNQVSANYVDSAQFLSNMATGSNLPVPPSASTDNAPPSGQSNGDGSLPQPNPSVQPKVDSPSDFHMLANQAMQLRDNAKGAVPQAVIDTTHASTMQAIAKGAVAYQSSIDGSSSVADSLQQDPKTIIPDQALSHVEGELPAWIAQQRQQGAVEHATASDNALKVITKTVQQIQQGNPPPPAVLEHIAMASGGVAAGPKGKADRNTMVKTAEMFQAEQDAYDLKMQTYGQPFDKAAQMTDNFLKTNDDTTHAGQVAKMNLSSMMEAYKKSGADYALVNPPLKRVYDASISNLQQNPNDPGAIKTFQNVLQSVAEPQMSVMGVTPDTPPAERAAANARSSVVPQQTAQEYVQRIQNSTTQDAVKILGGIKSQYGDYASNAMNDLVKNGLDAKYLPIAALDGKPIQATYLNALNLDSNQKGKESADAIIKSTFGEEVKNKLDAQVGALMAPFVSTAGWSDNGLRQGNQITQGVSALAKSYLLQGGSIKPTGWFGESAKDPIQTAAQRAFNDLIDSQFAIGNVNGKNFAVMRSNVQGDADSVVGGAAPLLHTIAAGKIMPQDRYMMPNRGYMYGLTDDKTNQDQKDEFQNAISRYGSWMQTSDGKRLRLVLDQSKVMNALGIKYPTSNDLNNDSGTNMASVMNVDNKPIEVPLNYFGVFKAQKDRENDPSNALHQVELGNLH